MMFPHGKTVYRLRAKLIIDPYSGTPTPGDWDDPDVLPIPGAFVAQSSTAMLGDSTRTQALENMSLYCAPAADVRLGDRIRDGENGDDDTLIYPVDGIPAAVPSPFTGWQPIREVPLKRAVG